MNSTEPGGPPLLKPETLQPSIGLNLLLLALGASLLFVGLGSSRVLTQHEVFAAEPAREMLSDGHWIIPTFGGIPRLVKPPTTGWLIAASTTLFQTRDEWAVRAPCALAGLITAVLVAAMAWRWLGYTAAVAAWCIQLTSYYLLLQARLAEADMPLCASVCAAMLAFACANVESPRGRKSSVWWAIGFHLAMAASFLFKGLVGPLFILSACLCFIASTKQWRSLRFLFHPAGLALFLLLSAAWPIAAVRKYPPILAIWFRETAGRAAGEYGAPESWYFYLWNVPMLLLPWTPLVILGAIAAWRMRWHRTPLGLFLVSWFVPGTLFLSVVAFKHKHYVIPMLPPFTLLAVIGLKVWLNDAAIKTIKSQLIAAGVWIFLCAVGMAVNLKSHQPAQRETSWIIAIVAAGGVAFITCLAQRRPLAAGAFLFGLIASVAVIVNVFLIRHFDEYYQESTRLARRTNNLVPKNTPIHLVGLGEAHIAYYLRTPFDRAEKSDIAAALAAPADETRYVLTTPGVIVDEISAHWLSQPLAAFSQSMQILAALRHSAIVDSLPALKRKQDESDRIILIRYQPRI